MKSDERFPMGFWNYADIQRQGPEDVRDWDEAGMTLTLGPEYGLDQAGTDRMVAILDECARRDIRLILCHAHSSYLHLKEVGEETFKKDFAAAVAAIGPHPALYGFHVGDEPMAENFEAACRTMRLQREVAPNLTPFLNLMSCQDGFEGRVGFTDWADYLDAYTEGGQPDFYCYDCYMQMIEGTSGWETYFTNLRHYHEAEQRHGIPFWTTLLSCGHFGFHYPKEDDLRWQLSSAVAHGAKGLLWFFFYMRHPHCNYQVPPIDEHYERTETYQWLSRICRTFLKTTAPVLRQAKLRRVSHVGQAWGGTALFDGQGIVQSARSLYDVPLIVSEFQHPDGSDYVLVVNNATTGFNQAELSVQARDLHHVGWDGEENLPMGPGKEKEGDLVTVTPWLAPGQMELWRVEPL